MKPDNVMKMVQKIGTCMFTTVDTSGGLVSRPIGIAHIDDDHTMWFFSPADSEKVNDVLGEGQVNLAFVDDKTWVSVSGTATVSTDEDKKSQLADLGAEAYFADGAEDPQAALLRVDPETAQYWQGPGSTVALVKLARAAFSDDQPSMGEQGKVDL